MRILLQTNYCFWFSQSSSVNRISSGCSVVVCGQSLLHLLWLPYAVALILSFFPFWSFANLAPDELRCAVERHRASRRPREFNAMMTRVIFVLLIHSVFHWTPSYSFSVLIKFAVYVVCVWTELSSIGIIRIFQLFSNFFLQ